MNAVNLIAWIISGLSVSYLLAVMVAPSLSRKWRERIVSPLETLMWLGYDQALFIQKRDANYELRPYDRDKETGSLLVGDEDDPKQYDPSSGGIRHIGKAKIGVAYEKMTPVFDVPFSKIGEQERRKVSDGGDVYQDRDGEKYWVRGVGIPEEGVLVNVGDAINILSEGGGADLPRRVYKHAVASQKEFDDGLFGGKLVEAGITMSAYFVGALTYHMATQLSSSGGGSGGGMVDSVTGSLPSGVIVHKIPVVATNLVGVVF
ncbi:MAG: hypothetical protein SV253_09070 [Halobacteria archaeon]|nr:hypothetical protein [Halobacteria archaeon]